ncbi:AraC family transcriptional regulator [Niveibacterium umoris]|uniref:AraC-like DNA-binding protein/quercetin dioxygenase-like cupin family protein n=1 Tax=Niveibacterium umoris TaxID=1193620 RepID=A0A840BI64_9RHOO|nr:AraC family transcriptional regulator [Niveibacterium umoris]MBB4011289.1 AraC-like DNA-binding protein/quercetin dioxygenase-like cupin family protein [Niveibacterium umoris]
MALPELLPFGADNAIQQAIESAYLPEFSGTFKLQGAHFRRVPPGWSYPRHSHRHFELVHVVEGHQHTETTSGVLEQGPGDLMIVLPGDLHSAHNKTNQSMGYWCQHFDVDDVALRQTLCLAGTAVLPKGSPVASVVEPVVQKLIAAARQSHEDSFVGRLTSLALLCELLSALARGLQAQFAETPPFPPNHLQAAGKLARWIEAQIDAPHSEEPIETLVTRLGYSTAHGLAMFTRVYGMSPRQYRSRLKLRRALELLRDPMRPIAEIGEVLGYDDPAHFSRQFKRWSGLSPLQYRRSQTG